MALSAFAEVLAVKGGERLTTLKASSTKGFEPKNRLNKIALPEPVLKYFSNSLAV